jgi:hypothetical protein
MSQSVGVRGSLTMSEDPVLTTIKRGGLSYISPVNACSSPIIACQQAVFLGGCEIQTFSMIFSIGDFV